MATYRNPWHTSNGNYGPAFFSTDEDAVEYRGYLIYNRIPAPVGRGCWDVVKDGVCIAQRAGPNGARAAIDQLSA